MLSPRHQAFSRISKLFQGNSKEIPWISKLFQGFPNFFLGRFEENQGVVGHSARNRLFSNFCLVSAATSGPAVRRRTGSRFTLARIPIFGKKLSRRFSARGVGARAASHAPTRKPTAATQQWVGGSHAILASRRPGEWFSAFSKASPEARRACGRGGRRGSSAADGN